MNFFKNNRGAAAVEFALVALPVMLFMLGIIQTGYILWIDNLLHLSVNVAARCGAVNSATPPCNNDTTNITTNMISAATTAFAPISSSENVKFLKLQNNGTCTSNGGTGLTGTYTVNFLYVVNLILTADSCYPTVS